MILDSKLANILSSFCLDIAKALFIVTFVTPAISNTLSLWEIFLSLTKGMAGVIIGLVLSWQFAKIEENI